MTWVYRPGHPLANENGMVEKEYVMPHSFPAVISDTMNPTRHMASGRVFDSKKAFRNETRTHGCIEVGNEPLKPHQPIRLDKGQRREDIKRALYELRNGSGR